MIAGGDFGASELIAGCDTSAACESNFKGIGVLVWEYKATVLRSSTESAKRADAFGFIDTTHCDAPKPESLSQFRL